MSNSLSFFEPVWHKILFWEMSNKEHVSEYGCVRTWLKSTREAFCYLAMSM